MQGQKEESSNLQRCSQLLILGITETHHHITVKDKNNKPRNYQVYDSETYHTLVLE